MTQHYSRRPQPLWAQSFTNTMVGRIILANVVVFAIQNIFPAFTTFFALRPQMVVENFMIWQLVTHMFLHGGFFHLLFNMFMLWIFGASIESVWGGKTFLRYYLICGLGGAVLSLIFNYNAAIVGASGAIFGLYLAYAVMFPDNYIYLYFVFPIKAKYLVAGMAILQLINGITGPSGVAYFAHLGGMAAGLLFFRSQFLQRARFSFGARRKWKSYVANRGEQQEQDRTNNIDSILDKISSKGVNNLSSTERRILENYSRKHRDKSD